MQNLAAEDKSMGHNIVAENNDVISSSGAVDDALRFLKAEGPTEDFSDIDEKRLLRKIDWFIMPILFGVYFLQFTDKSLCEDVHNVSKVSILILTVPCYSKLRRCNGYHTRQ
jgi:hypothetical protein